MERLFKRLPGFILGYHKALVLLCLLLCASSLLLVYRLELKTDMLDVLPADDPEIRRFKEFLRDFGSTDHLIIVVEPLKKDVTAGIEAVEELAKRLEASGYIDYADYNVIKKGVNGGLIKNFPLYLDPQGLDLLKKRLSPAGIDSRLRKNRGALLSPLSSPATLELIAADPLDIRSIVMGSLLKKRAISSTGYYASPDDSIFLIFVKPRRPSTDVKFVPEFEKKLRAVTDGFGDSVKIGLTGPYAFAMEAHASLKKEVLSNFLISTALIIILFQFVYRKRFAVLVITAMTLIISLTLTLAAAYLLFGGLNLTSSVVSVMLMGMGIDYIIHVFNRWEEEYRRDMEMEAALSSAFTRVLPGVVSGALTTAVAFFSIVFTDFRGLFELGAVAGIGVLSCLLVTVFFMSSVVAWLGPALVSKAPAGGPAARIASALIRQKRPVLFVWAAILAVSVVMIPSVRFDSDPESMGIKDSPVAALEKKISKAFRLNRNPLLVTVREETKGGLLDGYDKLEEAIRDLEASKTISGHSSLGVFLPPPSDQERALERLKEMGPLAKGLEGRFLKAMKENGFAENAYYEKYIKGVREALLIERPLGLDDAERIGDRKIKTFYNPDALAIAAYLSPPDGGWGDGSIKAVEEGLRPLGKRASLTGASVMLKTLKGAIIRESSLAAAITFVLITLIIFIQFRSLKWVALIISSITASFILTLGAMSLLSIRFNYINIASVALMFGIGVDYSIYIVQGYLDSSLSVEESLARTLRSVVMCALTTAVSFGSLFTMSFRGISSMGLIITIGIAMSIASALLLLPALVSSIDEGKGGR